MYQSHNKAPIHKSPGACTNRGDAALRHFWRAQFLREPRAETPNAIGWQRGTDRFVVINKAAEGFEINSLATSLQPGEYKEVRTGWRLDVQPGGTIQHWSVPGRSAMMFVRVSA